MSIGGGNGAAGGMHLGFHCLLCTDYRAWGHTISASPTMPTYKCYRMPANRHSRLRNAVWLGGMGTRKTATIMLCISK